MGDTNNSQLQCIEEVLGPQRGHLYIVIPILIIYFIILFTGIIGNISTCIVISNNKSMHTATNYYLFSLAISDLVLLLSGLPQEMYSIWSRYPYIFGGTFCFLHGLFAESSANATVYTITAFTVERYLAICHPLRSRTMSKLSRAIKIILCIWFCSVLLAVPQAMQFKMIKNGDCEICHFVGPIIEHSFEVSTLVFFVGPITLITVLYILIGLKLKSSNKMKRKNVSDGAQRKSSRKIVKMLVAVVVAFFICWAPFHIQRLFTKYSSQISNKETHSFYLKIYEILTYISGILYYVSATINPILYNIMSVKFREAFKETFSRCCCCSCFKSRRCQRSYSVLSRSAPSGCQGKESSTESGKDDNPSSQTQTTISHKESTPSLSDQNNIDKGNNRCFKKVIQKDFEENSIKPYTEIIKPENNICNNYEMKICKVDWKFSETEINNASVTSKSKLTNCCQLFQNEKEKNDDRRKKFSEYYEKHYLDVKFYQTKKVIPEEPSDISNSSLKDIEKDALEDELTTYMKKIQKRNDFS